MVFDGIVSAAIEDDTAASAGILNIQAQQIANKKAMFRYQSTKRPCFTLNLLLSNPWILIIT